MRISLHFSRHSKLQQFFQLGDEEVEFNLCDNVVNRSISQSLQDFNEPHIKNM
jgi:hypothetical protein